MCEYCKGGVAIVDGKYLGLVIFYTSYGGSTAYLRGYDKQGWDTSETFKINYCPMCGEKLYE